MILLLDLAHGLLCSVTVSRHIAITLEHRDGEKQCESGGSSWLGLPFGELEVLRGTDACKGIEVIYISCFWTLGLLTTLHTLHLVDVCWPENY